MEETQEQPSFSRLLQRVYSRPPHPLPFSYGGNLPYSNRKFSERILALHLDENDPAASRTKQERKQQIEWFETMFSLAEGMNFLDVACGPGLYGVPLAKKGVNITGIDFAPAAINHAKTLSAENHVSALCDWREEDMLSAELQPSHYDASILLYGQLAVMEKEQASDLLRRIAHSLKDGGKLCIEMLHPARVDKENSSWWFTDDSGLWGDEPYLHLGERIWYPDENISLERYHILHLDGGTMDEIILCDQVYETAEMVTMLENAGFSAVEVIPHWGELDLYDKEEWVVYLATK